MTNTALLPIPQTTTQPSTTSTLQPISTSVTPTLQPTTAATAPPSLSSTTPSLADFISEAKKLGQEQFAATLPILQQQAEAAGTAAGHKLYGQNVSLEGGLGKQVVQNTLRPILEARAGTEAQINAKLGEDALNKFYNSTQNRLQTTLQKISTGEYAPTEEDKTFLKSQGFGGTLTPTAKVDLQNKFGNNPTTGQSFQSDQEAIDFFSKKNQIDQLDIDKQKQMQDVALRYGVKPDGSMFPSEQDAQNYWTQKSLETKYGKPTGGGQFGSEQEALSYWTDQNFNKQIVQKYGLAPNGIPWPSEQMALDYWQKQGFSRELTQKYGLRPDGQPFASDMEAQKFTQAKELSELRKNIKDPSVSALIDSKEEFAYYMENGRTYEDDVAEIIRTAKTLEDWRSRLPKLEAALGDWAKKIDGETGKANGWWEQLVGGGRDQGKIDHYKQQYALLAQAVGEVNAGKVPIISDYEINSATGG